MNQLEVRYLIFDALEADDAVDTVDMISPVPGKPVELEFKTKNLPYDKVRKYKVTIEELD